MKVEDSDKEKRNDLLQERMKAVTNLIDGKSSVSEAVEELSKPIDIYVEPSHPMMMENPLSNTDNYSQLVTDPFSGDQKTEMLRVKDNPLAKDVISSGTIDILDKRVNVTALNQGDLNIIGSGSVVSSS